MEELEIPIPRNRHLQMKRIFEERKPVHVRELNARLKLNAIVLITSWGERDGKDVAIVRILDNDILGIHAG